MNKPTKNTESIVNNVGPTKEPTDIDIAWLAGFYEGEGTCKGDIKGRTTVRLSQKDPEILFRCRELIGGAIHKTRAHSDKYLHVLSLCGDNGRRFLQAIYPFMSTRRKMQIEKAGGLRLTGAPQGRSNRIMSEERRIKRASMTKKQRDVESTLYGRSLDLEKARARDREYQKARRRANPEYFRARDREYAARKRQQNSLLSPGKESATVTDIVQ